MRIRIDVATSATELPWGKVLSPGRSLLYDLLARNAPAIGTQFHEKGAGPYGMVPLGYSAPMFPKAERRRGTYAVGGRGWIELATPLLDVAAVLAQGIKQRELLDWGGAAFRVLGANLIEPPAYASGRGRFRTGTPVVMKGTGIAESGERITRQAWLMPTDAEYPVFLQRNLQRKAETLGLDSDVTLTAITWIGSKRSFSVGHGAKPGAPIEAELTGPPLTLQAIWSWGLGQANAAGFGWIAG
ncbi:CRISPR-associated endoribonuclease Cas6 [Sinosporangium album]|uniref:CRISPR-associated endoribonuclease Cas6 n=1 Tax=Sinosporangium album TaxID=504805 RepID=A0A1G7VSA4_9ACTN|nr:CRISPR-associated endoribonuclease Cas6 [Sinosporangium album]SDG62428.1 CRISPR-associated endoribonuclease Cas6 [Sinosporangium album]